MKKIALWVSILLVLSFVVGACGEVPAAPSAEGDSAPDEVSAEEWPAEVQELIDQAVADIAEQAHASPGNVEVVEVEAVQWPNSCLGCAAEGQQCLQVIVDGYRLILQVGEQTYEYHTGPDSVILCQEAKEADDEASLDEAPEALVDQAVADVAKRAQVDASVVQVLEVEAVEWPDACLGCHKESEACATVITPGYRLVLQANDQTYEYHTDMERILYCQEDVTVGADQDHPMVGLVVADLASQLGLSQEEISVVQVEEVSWRDSSLGCPQEGQMYLQVITAGYRITLEAQGQQYFYHTDSETRFVLCEKPAESN